MIKLFIIITTILMLALGAGEAALAQNQEQALIDSLLTELHKAKKDTNKVNTLNALSYACFRTGNYEEEMGYAKDALMLAEKLQWKKGIANALKNTGIAYTNVGNYPLALEHYFAALKIFDAIADKKGIANCHNNIGIIYYYQGNYPEVLKNNFAALKLFEETGDKRGVANAYNNIGNVYYRQDNYPEVLKNYFAALKLFEETGDKKGIATAYNNIGTVYHIRGNYPEALKNNFAALKIYGEIGDKQGIADTYNNIGLVYSDQGNYPEALKNYFAALKINELIGNKLGAGINCSSIGLAYTMHNHAGEGKRWLQKGLKLNKETGAKEWIKNSYSGLATADSALGNYKGALESYKMYVLYKDSLYNEKNTKKLTQTEMQYAFDKKQLADSLRNMELQNLADIKLQKQRTYTLSGAGIAALLLLFLVFFFRSNKKLSAEKQKSDSLLLNILPAEVAEELKEKGNSEARQFDDVSVLFTDFVHFTQTAETLSPEILVQELNECFTAFDNIMERNGLEKIKTIGDAYLAVCGLPVSDPQHAQKTVRAALEIRDFIEERKKNEKVFEIRIGVNSGSVVAGIVGVKKFAYDIWGDTVNTAARMEQSGEAGKVNISETTYHLVKDKFTCTYRGKVTAKGKGEIDMYFVS